MIYFIRMGRCDTFERYFYGLDGRGRRYFEGRYPIKIGFSTDPIQRLEQLQTGNPFWLYLHAVIEGCRDVENKWHKRFSEYRVSGEWFTYDYTIGLAIEEAVQHQVAMQLITNPNKTKATGYINQAILDELIEQRNKEYQNDEE